MLSPEEQKALDCLIKAIMAKAAAEADAKDAAKEAAASEAKVAFEEAANAASYDDSQKAKLWDCAEHVCSVV